MKLVEKELVENCECKPVCFNNIKSDYHVYVPDMIKIIKENFGIGLAAPQVGLFRRFFVMKYGGNDNYISCFNPKILFSSPQKSAFRESCLTYPNALLSLNRPSISIMRPKTIKVEYQNENGEIITIKLRGLEAKCFQHELDHLTGITIFNRGTK